MTVLDTYDVGDQVTYTVTFRNAAGNVADPNTVTFKTKTPTGTITTFTVTPGQVVKDSTGIYHLDIVLTMSGTWFATGIGSGAGGVIAASEDPIPVSTSQF